MVLDAITGILGTFAFVLVMYWLAQRKRRRAPRRAKAFASGAKVAVPVWYEDSAGRELTKMPIHLNGDMTVICQAGQPLRQGKGHPLLLGDFDTFWAHIFRDVEEGTAVTITDEEDICFLAQLPWPQGATVIVLLAKSDWSILRSGTR